MTVLVTKASSDYWYQIRNIDTIEDLMRISKTNKSYIVKENWNYGENPKNIAQFWDGMTLRDAAIISTLPYEVKIYDDYVEQKGENKNEIKTHILVRQFLRIRRTTWLDAILQSMDSEKNIHCTNYMGIT